MLPNNHDIQTPLFQYLTHIAILCFSCPWTPQEANYTTAVTDQTVQSVTLLLLVRLPLAQRLQQILVLHHQVKVKSEEHRHPGLGQLIVSASLEARCQSTDEMQQLVGRVVAITDGERSELQICARWGKRLEMLDEFIVYVELVSCK